MKKSKIIIIGIVVALVLVGGAYAAWTAQTEFTVNASAGELDVEISEVSIEKVSDYVEFDKKSVQISKDKKSASVSIENLYPGAKASVVFEITNTGTLPVALDKAIQKRIEVINTETNKKMGHSLMSALEMKYKGYVTDSKGRIIARIGSDKVNGSSSTSTIFKNNKAVIEPGEKVIIELTISMKENAGEDTENMLFRFSVTPYFTQGT